MAEARQERQAIDERIAEAALLRSEWEVRSAGLVERRRVLTERLREVERRLTGHADERREAAERRTRLEADATAVARLLDVVGEAQARLDAALAELRERYRLQLEAVKAGGARLEELRRQRSANEHELAAARSRLQKIELDLVEATIRRETVVETLRHDLACTPDEALAAPAPELAEDTDPPTRIAQLEAELAALGPVNPLALEELSELNERHQFLEAQVEDVRNARRELHHVIRTLDEEIMHVFDSAFADVNEHFSTLVNSLFPGGTGRLSLTDPEDLLDTGVEVEVRPAGRNVRRLSLLSGGERSLVALAFLFAVFRSRPSPFYLMDEVEAALDDVNLQRFLGLVHEFRGEAQLIIVSHQKRTMEAADALYGVTMAPGGSSKVVSQKVPRDRVDPDGVAESADAGRGDPTAARPATTVRTDSRDGSRCRSRTCWGHLPPRDLAPWPTPTWRSTRPGLHPVPRPHPRTRPHRRTRPHPGRCARLCRPPMSIRCRSPMPVRSWWPSRLRARSKTPRRPHRSVTRSPTTSAGVGAADGFRLEEVLDEEPFAPGVPGAPDRGEGDRIGAPRPEPGIGPGGWQPRVDPARTGRRKRVVIEPSLVASGSDVVIGLAIAIPVLLVGGGLAVGLRLRGRGAKDRSPAARWPVTPPPTSSWPAARRPPRRHRWTEGRPPRLGVPSPRRRCRPPSPSRSRPPTGAGWARPGACSPATWERSAPRGRSTPPPGTSSRRHSSGPTWAWGPPTLCSTT